MISKTMLWQNYEKHNAKKMTYVNKYQQMHYILYILSILQPEGISEGPLWPLTILTGDCNRYLH